MRASLQSHIQLAFSFVMTQLLPKVTSGIQSNRCDYPVVINYCSLSWTRLILFCAASSHLIALWWGLQALSKLILESWGAYGRDMVWTCQLQHDFCGQWSKRLPTTVRHIDGLSFTTSSLLHILMVPRGSMALYSTSLASVLCGGNHTPYAINKLLLPAQLRLLQDCIIPVAGEPSVAVISVDCLLYKCVLINRCFITRVQWLS